MRLLGVLFLVGAFAIDGPELRKLYARHQQLVFDEEFHELDVRRWKHELTLGGGGNWEFQYYLQNRTNSFVDNGVLHIKPTLTADRFGLENVEGGGFVLDMWGSNPGGLCTGNAFFGCERAAGGGGNVLNPIQSARVRTAESFDFRYGRLEVRAKLPKGDWLWPAIWLMPADFQYGDWPASGEMDLVESRGNKIFTEDGEPIPGGVDSFGSTLHWGPFFEENQFNRTTSEYQLDDGTDFSDEFHVFGLIWTSELIITYLDTIDNVVLLVDRTQTSFWEFGGFEDSPFDNPWAGRGNIAPFDREFYLIMNVAVGGTTGYWDDDIDGKPWQNESPNAVNDFWNDSPEWLPTWEDETLAMQVDWVRIFQ